MAIKEVASYTGENITRNEAKYGRSNLYSRNKSKKSINNEEKGCDSSNLLERKQIKKEIAYRKNSHRP